MFAQKIKDILSQIPQKNAFNEVVTLLAVTKKQDMPTIYSAINLGLYAFAESTVQEFLQKYTAIANNSQLLEQGRQIQWHFIGKLQRNKVKYLVNKIDLLHSLDSYKLAEEIERQGEKKNWTCRCLLQINIANESTKGGFTIEQLQKDWQKLLQLQHIQLAGFMAILPKNATANTLMHYATQMRILFDKYKALSTAPNQFCHLSMGISNDYTICLNAGSNMLRLGTALFGERS